MSATDVEHRDESGRRVWWGLALVAAGIVVLMLIAIQMLRDRPSSPEAEDALAVTTAYMQALEARDHPALSATAIEGLVVGLFVGSLEAIETEFEWMAAVEWEVEWTGCDVTSPDPLNSTVTCTANHSTAWGRALGVGPFTGERYFRVHHDGQEILGRFIEAPTVTQSATQLRDRAFVDEVWEPFVDWLASTRPEQVDSVLSTRVGEDGVDVFFTAIAFRR